MIPTGVTAAVKAAADQLVTMRQAGGATFLNLPMLYPDGSCVTVKIEQVASGIRVSDGGFAYREIESLGAERSFGRTATNIVEEEGVQANRRVVFVDTQADQLFRAICDVASASWRITEKVYERISDDDETEVAEVLRDRLKDVFGSNRLREEHKIIGSSATEWDVSAVVDLDGSTAVFHAVGPHPNSIYKTATAFHDIAMLDRPPHLVSVVKSKLEMGHNLALLAQAGRVIEAAAPNDAFTRAAA